MKPNALGGRMSSNSLGFGREPMPSATTMVVPDQSFKILMMMCDNVLFVGVEYRYAGGGQDLALSYPSGHTASWHKTSSLVVPSRRTQDQGATACSERRRLTAIAQGQ